MNNELYHHGILGQEWGVRNGPPYPLSGGDYTRQEKQKISRAKAKHNKIYSKKHFDKVISKGQTLATLSYDKRRTEGADMFYAAYDKMDKHQYNALFNKKIPQDLYDENGEKIGTGEFYKYRIKNVAKDDIKVASEDSGTEAFLKLYSTNRDFYNFVTDPNRMQARFVDDKYKFKGYREARDALERMRNTDKPTEEDVRTVYRMFNYVIPSDGGGDARAGKDVATQRAKLFKQLKQSGYSALLDTNDSIYGAFKVNAAVIVFDQEAVTLSGADRVSTADKKFSELMFIGSKILHMN